MAGPDGHTAPGSGDGDARPRDPAATASGTPAPRHGGTPDSRAGAGAVAGMGATDADTAETLRARQRSTRRNTRVIRAAKWLLPVAALAVLASIFLTGTERGGLEDMLSPEEIARLGAGLRLEQPRFAGRTPGGQPFVLRAEAAEPESALADEIVLIRPQGSLTLADGRTLEGSAEGGMMRRTAETLTLTGAVTLTTDDGYRFATDSLTVDLARRGAQAPGAISMSGPDGTLDAGRMAVVPAGGEAGEGDGDPAEATLRFEGGVRVLFTQGEKD